MKTYLTADDETVHEILFYSWWLGCSWTLNLDKILWNYLIIPKIFRSLRSQNKQNPIKFVHHIQNFLARSARQTLKFNKICSLYPKIFRSLRSRKFKNPIIFFLNPYSKSNISYQHFKILYWGKIKVRIFYKYANYYLLKPLFH